MEELNQDYLEKFQKLYSEITTNLQIFLKCGNFLTSRCPKRSYIKVSIEASDYEQIIATKMNENRSKREEEINRLFLILDSVAIQCAHLEHIS